MNHFADESCQERCPLARIWIMWQGNESQSFRQNVLDLSADRAATSKWIYVLEMPQIVAISWCPFEQRRTITAPWTRLSVQLLTCLYKILSYREITEYERAESWSHIWMHLLECGEGRLIFTWIISAASENHKRVGTTSCTRLRWLTHALLPIRSMYKHNTHTSVSDFLQYKQGYGHTDFSFSASRN